MCYISAAVGFIFGTLFGISIMALFIGGKEK
jgi:hypothetical protein